MKWTVAQTMTDNGLRIDVACKDLAEDFGVTLAPGCETEFVRAVRPARRLLAQSIFEKDPDAEVADCDDWGLTGFLDHLKTRATLLHVLNK